MIPFNPADPHVEAYQRWRKMVWAAQTFPSLKRFFCEQAALVLKCSKRRYMSPEQREIAVARFAEMRFLKKKASVNDTLQKETPETVANHPQTSEVALSKGVTS